MTNWNNINSEKFLKRLKLKDEIAFAELYMAVVSKLVPFLSKYFKDEAITEADIEEIANDTMKKVKDKIEDFKYKQNAKLTTWIFEIGKNKTKDFLRQFESARTECLNEFFKNEKYQIKENKRLLFSNLPTLENSVLTGTNEKGHNLETSDDKIARQAFDMLSEKDQDIIRMRHVMSYEDIAEVENMSVNALKTRYSRATERFETSVDTIQKNIS